MPHGEDERRESGPPPFVAAATECARGTFLVDGKLSVSASVVEVEMVRAVNLLGWRAICREADADS